MTGGRVDTIVLKVPPRKQTDGCGGQRLGYFPYSALSLENSTYRLVRGTPGYWFLDLNSVERKCTCRYLDAVGTRRRRYGNTVQKECPCGAVLYIIPLLMHHGYLYPRHAYDNQAAQETKYKQDSRPAPPPRTGPNMSSTAHLPHTTTVGGPICPWSHVQPRRPADRTQWPKLTFSPQLDWPRGMA